MSDARTTTDHDVIRGWAEERDGHPATVEATEQGDAPGVLTIHFPGVHDDADEALEDIPWDEWFAKFEDERLAFLHQDRTADGSTSRFFKLVARG